MPTVFDPSVLAQLPMVADGSQPEFAEEMLQLFESTSTSSLRAIEAALASGDNTTLQRHMHTLKSSGAQVGALELAALAQIFESELRAGRPASTACLPQLRDAHQRLLQAWPLARHSHRESTAGRA